MINKIAPKTFLRSSENMISTYNWVDIASGEGIIEFMGFGASTADNTFEYLLTTNGNLDSMPGTATLNGFSQKFEAVINNRMVITGTAYIQVPVRIEVAAGGTSVSYVTITIYHYDGTTETAISSSVESDHISTDAAAAAWNYIVVKVPISGASIFSKGDKLRVGVVGVGTGTGTRTQIMGFIPNGRDAYSLGGDTRLSAFIPVKIDL